VELTDITVEVRDRDLNRVGVILPTDATFLLRDEFCNVGMWEITLPLEHPMVSKLRAPGAGIIVTGPLGTLLSGPVQMTSSVGNSEAPEGMVTISGLTDDVVLSDALAYAVPESATMAGQTARANDIRSGPLESVLHAFVNANIGPGAPAARRKARLVMGTNLGRGPSVTKSARFPVLGTLLNEISALSNIGFRVIQRGSQLVFETYEIADRTKTIRMDLWNNALASYDVQTAGATVTRTIVAGQDEGVKRQLLERSTAESIQQESLWGRRIEKFLDRRSTNDLLELAQAGDEVLKKQGVGQAVIKFVPMDDSTMRFMYDWGLGDKVTAVVEGNELAALVQAAIIKIDEQGVRLACALGDEKGTSDQIQAFMSQTEARVSAIERTVEVSAQAPEAVPASNDMDSYLDRGVYSVNTNAIAQTIAHIPAALAGQLVVTVSEDGRGVYQDYTTYTGRGYRRVRHATRSDWSPWAPTTRGIVQAASMAELTQVIAGLNPSPTNPVFASVADQVNTSVYSGSAIDLRMTTDGIMWSAFTATRQPSPYWVPMPFEGGWTDYVDGYKRGAVIKTSAGIVKLRGLVKVRSGVGFSNPVAILPPGYRPDKRLIFEVAGSVGSDNACFVYVYENGYVEVGSSSATGWLSLSQIMFPAADPARVWTPLDFRNGWSSYHLQDPSFPPASQWQDKYGRVWLRGMISRPTLTGGIDGAVAAFILPEGARPESQIHVFGMAGGGWGTAHIGAAGDFVVKTGTASSAYFSLANSMFVPRPTAASWAWTSLPYLTGWQKYPGAYPESSVWAAPDGLVTMQGLLNIGAVPSNTNQMVPGISMSIPTMANTSGGTEIFLSNANNAPGRCDVTHSVAQAINGSNLWRSLNGIHYMQEG
jgi:hypothetical protein